MTDQPTPHAEHLLALAACVADAHRPLGARAALVAGSVAEGVSDEWSDVDLVLTYDELPDEAAIDAAREVLGGTERITIGGSHEAGVVLEQFRVDGVACQLVHQTVDAWRAQARTVLEDLDVDSPTQKAIAGLHEGIALFGDDVVATLRDEAGYPDALARAMVERHQAVFPLWRLQGSLARRDCALWQHGELVGALSNLLAVLAGVNRTWFSTFQLKKVRRLASSFEHAPDRLAERIDAALVAPPEEAAELLRDLVADVVEVVARARPDLSVDALRATLRPPLEPWSLSPAQP